MGPVTATRATTTVSRVATQAPATAEAVVMAVTAAVEVAAVETAAEAECCAHGALRPDWIEAMHERA